jgi:hypothetical protein
MAWKPSPDPPPVDQYAGDARAYCRDDQATGYVHDANLIATVLEHGVHRLVMSTARKARPAR